jgi:hypothetical protein
MFAAHSLYSEFLGIAPAKRIATIVSFGILLVVSREQLVVSRKQREQRLAAFAKWVH